MSIQLLEKVYHHPLMTANDIASIIKEHKKVSFKKGTFILKEGQIANSYLIIETGLLRSFVHDFNGNDITTNFYGSQEIAIEVSSLFQRIPTKENIQTLTECACWKIEFDIFQELFHSSEGFIEWGRSWMSNELFMLKQRSVTMLTKSATDRYLTLLQDKPQIIQQASLKSIASYLGITDTSLSRIRKDIFK
ncbi:MAG: Crp/Fnr family transcriptional regulator [Cellulophaga sp.]|nr:Crp/Fnr family transcriptional regulator [Cellulophaga sp.]